jgi:glycosyltransferase involved in cell wall biosynthesis
MNKIPLNISNSILTIGPDYKNHRGGIGAVLEVYSKYFENFKFIASYKVGSVLYKFIYFIFFLLIFFKKLFFDRSIRIVHIHGASRASFARKFICFVIAKYFFRKKIIYHIHGAEYHLFSEKTIPILKFLIKMFINNSDCIVCLSEVWKSFFTSNFNPKNIKILPNIIDYPSISTLNKESSVLEFLFLGQITNRKGIYDLIDVLSQNKEKYFDKIKVVVGGNGDVEKFKTIIKEKQINGLVEFIGWVTCKKKIYSLQSADVYILPSYNEGLPISILEAMSYGKAIISTNVGGIPEIVIPGRNGILIEPGNLLDIEEAIDFFIHNSNKIKSFGKESKNIVMKHLPDAVIMDLSIIYTFLLYE